MDDIQYVTAWVLLSIITKTNLWYVYFNIYIDNSSSPSQITLFGVWTINARYQQDLSKVAYVYHKQKGNYQILRVQVVEYQYQRENHRHKSHSQYKSKHGSVRKNNNHSGDGLMKGPFNDLQSYQPFQDLDSAGNQALLYIVRDGHFTKFNFYSLPK